MLKADIWCYDDVISHALDYMGAATDAQTERFARRAIQLAYSEMHSKRNWTYYYSTGHINTVAPYSTGTIEYDHTGGTYERQVTLTTGTWPAWAADGMLVIDQVPYPVTSRKSATVITLADANNPGADVAALTTYEIYREAYTLPVDFAAMDKLSQMNNSQCLDYTTPGSMLAMQTNNVSPANPQYYTITNDPNRHGVLALRLFPAPDQIYPFNFTYRRRPRTLRIDSYSTGTVSITNGSAVLTGNGTAWSSNLVGCMIRFSQGATTAPTGLSGANPFWLERSIVGFTSATEMTLDADPQQSLTSVKYSISDPVDIESGAMVVYFLREVERQCRLVKRMEAVSSEDAQYNMAWVQAIEADSRRFDRTAAGSAIPVGRFLKDMPVTADIE